MANRVLKRPMFRMGGSPQFEFQERTTGILSGLDGPKLNASRTGYQEGGRSYTDIFKQIREENKALRDEAGLGDVERKQGEPGSLSSALMNFGINLLAQPGGNLVGAIGKAGQQPLQQFQAARRADKAARRKEQLDEFETIGDRATDIFKAEEETRRDIATQKLKGKQVYAKKQAADEITSIFEKEIENLEKQKEGAGPEEIEQIDVLIKNKRGDLQDKVISILTDSQTRAESVNDIIIELIKQGELDTDLVVKYFPELKDLIPREEDAMGGRVGYQTGGGVMETVSESVDMVTQPAQTQDLTFNELRSRLPREISDDVVSLIATSKQALMDFAEIQTQQDVDNFNQTYNVNLVLPQEG